MPTPDADRMNPGPLSGLANQLAHEAAASLAEQVNPALIARKGRLYLILPKETEPVLAHQVYSQYYADRSYDIVPSLLRALSQVFEQLEGDTLTLGGIVVNGLDMHAVGSAQTALFLVRHGHTEPLFPDSRGRPMVLPSDDPRVPFRTLLPYNVRRTLYAGDTVIMSSREGTSRLDARAIRGVLRRSSAEGVAKAFSRALKKVGVRGTSPVTVVQIPGYAPMAVFDPPPRELPPKLDRLRHAPREGISPIWPTLLISIILVALSLLIRKPDIPVEELSNFLRRALLPTPTVTPTPSPSPPPFYVP